MSKLLAVLKKDLKLMMANRFDVAIIFLIPAFTVVLLWVFSGGNETETTTKGVLKVSLLDFDSTDISKRFVECIRQTNNIEVSDGTIPGIYINSGFKDKLMRLQFSELFDILGLNESDLSYNYLRLILHDVLYKFAVEFYSAMDPLEKEKLKSQLSENIKSEQALLINSFLSPDTSLKEGSDVRKAWMTFKLMSRRDLPNQDVDKRSVSFPVYLVMFLLFSSMGGSYSLHLERKRHIIRRLILSRLGFVDILMGKALSVIIVALFQILVIYVLAFYLFDISIKQSVIGFSFTCITLAFVSGALAVLLSGICRSDYSMHSIPVVVILAMTFIGGGGITFPGSMLGQIIEIASYLTPNRWANDAFANSMWKGGAFLHQNLILIFIAFLMFFAGVLIWKRQRESL
ncbi:MAG: ABC transporter permease [Planctomycetes bacterium]|nr:ABC transporter permease [Planctomycetota bacterium]